MPTHFLRTGIMIVVLTMILIAMGYLVAGELGMIAALVFSVITHTWAYWNSDQVLLKINKAREVDEKTAPGLFAIVRDIARRAELPMPKVFVIDNPQPNAFATGRNPNHAAICASTGLLELLNPNEVRGVLAHELAHVKNHDTLTMAIAATIGSAVSVIANILQFSLFFGGARAVTRRLGLLGTLAAAFLFPLAAMIVQLAISRSREYQADMLGSSFTRDPLSLASALEKISAVAKERPNVLIQRFPALAHLFIVNPLTGHGYDSLFSTHPSIENRVARLLEYARQIGETTPGEPPGENPPWTAKTEPMRPRAAPDQADDDHPRGPWDAA